ncbi:MAG: hypothetical protein U9Q21_00865 [Candidatus Auribacterota bacterium]|nr:hypothetical protein [Candidatus Auribacterota bacterium]
MNKNEKIKECWPHLSRPSDRLKFALVCESYLGKAKFGVGEAGRMAGYTEKSAVRVASKVLRHPGSREYMAWLTERAKAEGKDELVDVGWALKELRKLYDYCTLDQDGKFKKEGIDVEASRKLIKQLGEAIGLWMTRIETHITVEQVQTYIVQVVDIVRAEVKDPEVLNAISARFEKEIGLLEAGE